MPSPWALAVVGAMPFVWAGRFGGFCAFLGDLSTVWEPDFAPRRRSHSCGGAIERACDEVGMILIKQERELAEKLVNMMANQL